ncbi:MAG: hypothetical protein V4679_01220 [Pseudomonadota bacterium]
MEKTLLFESAVHPWKVYWVCEKPTWQAREHCYQVTHQGQPFVLPRALSKGVRDVDRFIAASAFETQETHADSVLLVFEHRTLTPYGFEERALVSVMAQSVRAGKGYQMRIANLQGQVLAVIEREPAR